VFLPAPMRIGIILVFTVRAGIDLRVIAFKLGKLDPRVLRLLFFLGNGILLIAAPTTVSVLWSA
jgi:hypothetical protein